MPITVDLSIPVSNLKIMAAPLDKNKNAIGEWKQVDNTTFRTWWNNAPANTYWVRAVATFTVLLKNYTLTKDVPVDSTYHHCDFPLYFKWEPDKYELLVITVG